MLFLLNGFKDNTEPEPYAAILVIGEVRSVEVSVGPAHYLAAPGVTKLAVSLAQITEDPLFEILTPKR